MIGKRILHYGKIVVSLFGALIASYFVMQFLFPYYTPKLNLQIPKIPILILDMFKQPIADNTDEVMRRERVWFFLAPTSVPTPTLRPILTRVPPPLNLVIMPTAPVVYRKIPTPTISRRSPVYIPTLTPVPQPPTPTRSIPTSPPLPTRAPTSVPFCWNMEKQLPPFQLTEPDAYYGTPQTSAQILAYDGSVYSLPYRNPRCQTNETLIKKAYERMRSYYPRYFPQTRLLNEWKVVQEKAKRYNFNPIFVIALWIEESAAGGATQSTQLGCDVRFDYRKSKDGSPMRMSPSSSICDQMLCLFNLRPAHPKNFVSFACQYQFGSSYYDFSSKTCKDDPNFVKTLSFWYEMLSEGQPSECRMKFL